MSFGVTEPFLHFFGGPARGPGSSGFLLRQYGRLTESGLLSPDSILVIKHKNDDPSHPSKIFSSSMASPVDALAVSSIEEIAGAVTPETEVVMVGGVHHFSDERTPKFLDELVQSGRRVFAAGTTLKGSSESFGYAGAVAAYADIHTWHRPPCSVGQGCQNRASRTLFDSSAGEFRPVCYSCHPRTNGIPRHALHCTGGIGSFTLFVGSMFAEKTEEAAQQSTETWLPQMWFKSDLDTRRGDERTVVTYNGTIVPAMTVYVSRKENPETADVIEKVVHDHRLRAVYIDEPFQFGDRICDVIERLVWQGVQVYASSILVSFESGLLPHVARLMALADEVVDSYAFCANSSTGHRCGLPASRNQRLILQGDDSYTPARFGDPLVLVGDSANRSPGKKLPYCYVATCRKHLVVPGAPGPLFGLPPVECSSAESWDASERYVGRSDRDS